MISSPVNKVENPSPIPFPFLSNQVSRPQPTSQRHSQPPFPKQTVPAPDGIDLGWSRDECRLASLSSLRPRASSLPMPQYVLLALLLFAPCRTHLQTEVPCGSRARGGHLRWSAQRRLSGVAGLAYTRNPTAERGASFLVMKSTTRNSASTPSCLITCSRCYSSGSITIIPTFCSNINLISLTLPLRSLPERFSPHKPEFRLSADSSPRLRLPTPTKWVTRMPSTWPSSPSRLSATRVCTAFDTIWRPTGRADPICRDGREHEDRRLRGP